MTVSEKIISIFSIISLLLGIYFLSKSKYKSNLWLSFILFAFSYQMFYFVLYWSNINEFLLVQLRYSSILLMAIHGPLFYMYVKSLVSPRKINVKDGLHFLPAFILLLLFSNYYALPYDIKLEQINSDIFPFILRIIPKLQWVLCFFMLFYVFHSYKIFKRYLKKDQDLVMWLKAIHFVYSIFVFGYFAYYALVYFELITTKMDYFITYIMIAFIGLTLYFGRQYKDIFNGKDIQKVIPFIKYQRTGLSKSFSNELKEKLEYLMKSEKPYLDYTLRLNNLADSLNVTRNHMSQVINEHFRVSFFEFINDYRIQYALNLLENDSDLSITDITYESGFNNRVSFYKAFKKTTGMTPTMYKEQLDLAS